jgi:Mg/Co/Ni transporter MgtE
VRSAAREVVGIPPARVRAALDGEPAHVAAAIISGLPTTTAAAVLELYSPDERSAIVRRLGRRNSALVPPPEDLIRDR